MNKTVKNLLIIALAMILAGAVFVAAAFGLGARLKRQWDNALFRANVNIGMGGVTGYRNWNNAYEADGTYALDATGIESVDLKWIAGMAVIVVSDGGGIDIAETASAPIPENHALRYGVENGTLYIQYCEAGTTGELPEKSLTVSIPKALAEQMADFSFDASSASLTLSGITAQRFTFDSSSGGLKADSVNAQDVRLNASSGDLSFSGAYGKLEADTSSGDVSVASLGAAESTSVNTSSGNVDLTGDCGALSVGTTSGRVASTGALSAKSLSVDTSSGDVSLGGSFPKVNVGTTSGTVRLDMDVCPGTLDVSTSSGDVTLVLPEQSGFTLRFNTSSGEMDCAFSVVMDGNKYVCGDGSADFDVDTSSGSLGVKAK